MSVTVSKLIQFNGIQFLLRNDAPAHVHFCTPLLTIRCNYLMKKGCENNSCIGDEN